MKAWLLLGLLMTMGATMQPPTTRASGTFDVTLKPVSDDDHTDGGAIGRMTVDKVYHGDLEGQAVAQMLTGMSPSEKTSGVYVAIERVTARLKDRKGSFILHHTGIMDRGAQNLRITVVPDSGTDQLAGISGTMTIEIKDGKHFYTFDYTLPVK
jgi:Protein of unknown function (DUF3224)